MLVIQKEFRLKLQGTLIYNLEVEALIEKYRTKQVAYEEVMVKFNLLKEYYLEINYALLTYDRQGYKEVLERVLTQIQDLKKQL